jgi:hypothetical protein
VPLPPYGEHTCTGTSPTTKCTKNKGKKREKKGKKAILDD